jgi:hypothetical protein
MIVELRYDTSSAEPTAKGASKNGSMYFTQEGTLSAYYTTGLESVDPELSSALIKLGD